MMKTRQDNSVTDCTSVVYAKIEIELWWLIGHDAVYNEKNIGQRHDES